MAQFPTDKPGIMIPAEGVRTLEQRINPFPWYETMRRTAPIRFDQARGCWDVFNFTDVHDILRDHVAFSSQRPQAEGVDAIGQSMLSMDPPRHTDLRGIVNKAFTPRAIANLESRIAVITDDLLNRVEHAGEMDVIRDLAYPLPVIVISELLGIPSADRDRFKEWSDVIVKGPAEVTPSALEALRQLKYRSQQELNDYFRDIIAKRRRAPQNDLISALIAAEIDGQHLTESELLSFASLLLAAGNETTTNLIGNAVRCFLEEGVVSRLSQQISLLPTAIEEVLRYYAPVQATNRTATRDMEIGGHVIRTGDQVVLWLGSANRDETHFTDAGRFNLARTPNPHIAFGHGIHFCLGAPLARLEARVALAGVMHRFPHFSGDYTRLEPVISSFVYGVKGLPIRLNKQG